jgi:uncharacterized membrane protein
MHTLYTLSVFLHVLAACAWIGAMVFFAVVVVPVMRQPEFATVTTILVRRIGARYRTFGWASIGVLVVTGFANLALRGFGVSDLLSAPFWSTPFGRTLATKLVFVAVTVLATASHDLLFGARTMALLARDPASPAARRVRRTASWLGRATLALSICVLLFAVWLVRGMPA